MDIDEISRLKEIFVIKYCRKKNWNINSLSTNQMLEITQTEEYKNAGVKH